MIEIQWTDSDPDSGARRYLDAVRFAREWRFRVRTHRRGEWEVVEQPTRSMWEAVLESLKRRSHRGEVTVDVVREVEKFLAEWREPPSVD